MSTINGSVVAVGIGPELVAPLSALGHSVVHSPDATTMPANVVLCVTVGARVAALRAGPEPLASAPLLVLGDDGDAPDAVDAGADYALPTTAAPALLEAVYRAACRKIERRRGRSLGSARSERTMMLNAGDAILIADFDTALFIEVNPAACAMFGYSPAEFGHLKGRDLTAPGESETVNRVSRAIHETGAALEHRHRLQRKDGTLFWAAVRLSTHDVDGRKQYMAIMREVTEQVEHEQTLERTLSELRRTQGQLVEASRKAGMAEVATNVLHNVGNVLNSVNVSAALVSNVARSPLGAQLAKAVSLLRSQTDPGAFLTSDPRGKKLFDYLDAIGVAFTKEREGMLGELDSLTKNIDHIKTIVSMQQSHAKAGGAVERLSLEDLIDDGLELMSASDGERQPIRIVREYADVIVEVDRHKIFQIVMNLLSNARQALKECETAPCVTVRTRIVDEDRVAIEVEDNGVGIPHENRSKIFSHGFTTKRDGHGFGLHASACAAIEAGATLNVHSDGAGTGARFTLVLPGLKENGGAAVFPDSDGYQAATNPHCR